MYKDPSLTIALNTTLKFPPSTELMLAIKWPYMSLAIKWPYDLSSNVQGPPFLNYSSEYNLKISPVKSPPPPPSTELMLAIKWPYMSLAIKWPYDLSSNVQGPPFLNYSPEYNLKISPVKFPPSTELMLAIKWPYMSLAIKWPYDLKQQCTRTALP